jgi:hypothetical protein
MDESSLFDSGNDDGSFVPFTDILFNIVLGFTVMMFISFALIKPDDKSGNVDINAEMLITATWPDLMADDIDMYVEDPQGNVVWYHSREQGLVHLDRDDRGNYRDVIMINGQEVQSPLNQETVTVRGFVPGEYVINVYFYLAAGLDTVPVTVKVEKLNPSASVVHYSTVNLTRQGQEETMVRFTLDAQGNVSDVNSRPKSLIAATRK